VVNESQLDKNLDRTKGLIFSGRVLLALVEWGLSREDAYAIVQENALRCWDQALASESSESYLSLLSNDARLAGFLDSGSERLKELFDIGYYLRHVDEIFARFEYFKEGAI